MTPMFIGAEPPEPEPPVEDEAQPATASADAASSARPGVSRRTSASMAPPNS